MGRVGDGAIVLNTEGRSYRTHCSRQSATPAPAETVRGLQTDDRSASGANRRPLTPLSPDWMACQYSSPQIDHWGAYWRAP